MKNFFGLLRLFVMLATASMHSFAAGVMLQPTGAFTEWRGVDDASDFGPYTTIDQSGLVIPYQSLIQDFDAYVAQTASNIFESGNPPIAAPALGLGDYFSGWAPDENETWIAFDLGAVTTISGFALWNHPQFGAPVKDFSIQISNSVDFSSSTSLGSFTASNNTLELLDENDEVFLATPVQTFSFPSVSGRYVKVEILTSHDVHFPVGGIGEIAFKSVPEPSSAIAFFSGFFVLAARRRRNRQE